MAQLPLKLKAIAEDSEPSITVIHESDSSDSGSSDKDDHRKFAAKLFIKALGLPSSTDASKVAKAFAALQELCCDDDDDMEGELPELPEFEE